MTSRLAHVFGCIRSVWPSPSPMPTAPCCSPLHISRSPSSLSIVYNSLSLSLHPLLPLIPPPSLLFIHHFPPTEKSILFFTCPFFLTTNTSPHITFLFYFPERRWDLELVAARVVASQHVLTTYLIIPHHHLHTGFTTYHITFGTLNQDRIVCAPCTSSP